MKRIRSHQRIAISHGNVHGRGAVLFGIIFMCVGAMIVCMGLDVIHVKKNVSDEMIIAIGLMFSFAGLFPIQFGLKDIAFRRWSKQRQALNPGQPWLWDHKWKPSGIKSRKQMNFIGQLFGLAIVGGFNYVAFQFGDEPEFKVFWYFIMLFNVVFVGGSLFWIARHLKYGHPEIHFDSFPFHIGRDLAVTIRGLPTPMKRDKLIARLNCYQERYDYSNKNKKSVVLKSLYEQELVLERNEIQESRPRLRFTLPEDDSLSSALRERPARFWQLYVRCKTPGVDFVEVFLLPVYP